MNLMRIFAYIYIISLFISIIHQPFGSYDMIGPQWFQLSLVNLIFLFIAFRFDLFNFLRNLISSPTIKIYLAFIFFAFFSIIFASDLSYFFHDLGRLLTSFLILLNLSFCFHILSQKKFFDFFFPILLTITFYEIYLSVLPYLIYFKASGFSNWIYVNIPPGNFKGIAGNKNITAALYVFKIPFLLYFLDKKSRFYRLLIYLALFLSFFILFFLQTRSTYISLSLLFSFYFIYLLLHKRDIFIYRFFYITSTFLISFIFFNNTLKSLVNENKDSFTSSIKSIELSNDSSSNRFSLWSHTIDYISSKPFGAGLGNWKLESIPYWNQVGGSYQVPYHAHNDFLEMTVETGFLGGIFYFILFLLPIWTSFKFSFINCKPDYIFIFLGFGVYFVDAFFNFPMERSYMQLLLSFYFVFFINKNLIDS